jgi:hypothetical protein
MRTSLTGITVDGRCRCGGRAGRAELGDGELGLDRLGSFGAARRGKIVGHGAARRGGLLVGALTVIPFVGTFVGAAIAALVTLADGAGMETLGAVGLVILVLHLLEAGVLTPKIVGHRVGLSETSALFAVVAGGKLLGFVGVVLAVPIAATCAVLVRYGIRYYEHTEFFGRESDADVVITPGMALIMPGIRLEQATTPAVTDTKISLPGDRPDDDDPPVEPELPASQGMPTPSDDDASGQ